ncbi:FadR/GntR family transcriptional regulator [Angustibacter sp. McL0619]|uniref:FadR/GntR family transcriptional regulator n=1 Tax=Angustibacter sp. McL0619 TaxID=3415676 RepID=UPI003CED6F05
MASTQFTPVARQSVSDTVLVQLREAILGGGYQPGDQLPPERELAQAFAVNRHAVREAVKRLQEAGFVQVVHGGGTRVLDVRRTAGLDLLGHLARMPDGALERLVRDGLEMRRCIGVDAARRGAERADVATRQAILVAAERYGDPSDVHADRDFWALVVDASDNLAFRLALNSLVESIDAQSELMDVLLADDRGDVLPHLDLAQAIADQDGERAAACADALLSQALTIHQARAGGRRRRPGRSA